MKIELHIAVGSCLKIFPIDGSMQSKLFRNEKLPIDLTGSFFISDFYVRFLCLKLLTD